ncbi:arylsulfotransferase protein [Purpureocillium lavendulum]|uniref:Arylsulfotransferase protein n=1 Tax=Purpureocillium lavendulum TaxID=1247861 RepID=A0AB34FHW9_9HYPO|nr:arylsulfotransferase protein [Purpureocillium lavendulum]
MRTPTTPLGLGLLSLLQISTASQVHLGSLESSAEDHVDASSWCDRGCYEPEPQQTYRSFNGAAPKLEVVRSDERCDSGLTFLEPEGWQAYGSGLATVDGQGDLVWKPTQWAEMRDVKVQRFGDALYMTFWVRDEGSDFGHYIMLDETYRMFKEIRPSGRIQGDIKNLLITSSGTAILTIDPETRNHAFRIRSSKRHNYGSVFQEIDLRSNILLFEWHASQHLTPNDGPIDSKDSCRPGGSHASEFNSFSIIAIDKNPERDGQVQWQLGGSQNSFKDLSDGLATTLPLNHDASWDTSGDNETSTLIILIQEVLQEEPQGSVQLVQATTHHVVSQDRDYVTEWVVVKERSGDFMHVSLVKLYN